MSFTLAIRNLFNTPVSNEELMLRYADSEDTKLLAQLYDNCANDLYHFLMTQTNNELAKDISQRTWLKVIEKKHLYRDSGRFTAWLFTMGRNLLIDDIRKNGRYCELNDEDQSSICHFAPSSNNRDILNSFNLALGQLAFEQREAFCLQQEGFGLKDISDITNTPIETIKSRLRYAKANLKKQLENYYD
ncbi:MAG: RNA polymerase sigma factor (sigma-70 family) [Paraglaciecola sp.]|jgi:RNA polymerase sigma factor (sigma-70 family)